MTTRGYARAPQITRLPVNISLRGTTITKESLLSSEEGHGNDRGPRIPLVLDMENFRGYELHI